MLVILLAFLMKFVDISKAHQQRCSSDANCNCWQHAAAAAAAANKACNSNSSSTSSGCDSNGTSSASSSSAATASNSSSKENVFAGVQTERRRQQQQQQQHQKQQQQQHCSITPQQLQQIRYYQHLQQQQLQLLQQQLLQRRYLQQQLHAQGVVTGVRRGGGGGGVKKAITSPAALTCNQQYLRQLRLQEQNRLQLRNIHNTLNDNDNNNDDNNDDDVLNNNNNGNNSNVGDFARVGFVKGHKSRRGMTEFSTNNDINNKSHPSQPLQNSPNHIIHPHQQQQPHHYFNSHHNHQQHQNSPQHSFANNISKQLTYINTLNQHRQQQHQQQIHNNNKNNQQTYPLNSSANISNINATTFSALSSPTSATSATSSPTHSPLHYKKPLNSPNNSPFAHYAYHDQQQQQQHAVTKATAATTAATTQQHLRSSHSSNKLPLLTQTQYQQHLNDLLLQQQHLQHQQQQLLSIKSGTDDDDELSEESLKQNVAIVLSNLDRYNNALRSIILNEQVTSNSIISNSASSSSVFFDDSGLLVSNNNFLLSVGGGGGDYGAAMAAAVTPESDYNSNATTPGSRTGNMLSLDSNMPQQQQQQHLVGFPATAACGGGGGGVGLSLGNGLANGLASNNLNSVGGGGGFCAMGNNVPPAPTGGNNLNCSLASSHDFTHDNSDYQWFLDYGYRDGCGGMQRSVLSSLSASYNGIGDMIYYEDLAKNLDANLAEVDMESFRAEDIHSLLSQLPSYCKSLAGGGGGSSGINSRLQQSLMMQQHMRPSSDSQQQIQLQQQQQQQQQMIKQQQQQQQQNGAGIGHSISQTSTTSTNELIDNSFCKSELLFSPVKETSHISVDSLDLDAYPEEGDIILTCKANKDNYTIAFEGSVLYSDESFYAEPNENTMRNRQNFINLHSNLEDIVKRKALEVSMSRSEQPFTARNKLQKSSTTQLQRYPSGNNNTSDLHVLPAPPTRHHIGQCSVRKSSSVPNLHERSEAPLHQELKSEQLQQQLQLEQPLNVSQAVETPIAAADDATCKLRNLLPMCQMPISCNSTSVSISERLALQCQQQQHHHQQHHNNTQQQQQQQQLQQRIKHRCCCATNTAAAVGVVAADANNSQEQQKHSAHISGSASSGNSNPPAFNLVKLFIKQKSTNCASENQASTHTCMDVSSGCWPSSEAVDGGSTSSSASLEQRLRKKSMNDSGKGSALSRHDVEDNLLLHGACRARDNAAEDENEDRNESSPLTFQNDANDAQTMTPKQRHSRLLHQHDGVFYDEERSLSSTGATTGATVAASSTNTSAHRRRSLPLRHPQLSALADATHNNSSSGSSGSSAATGSSLQSSDASRSNSEQLTQVYLSSGANNGNSGVSVASAAAAERRKSRRAAEAQRCANASTSSSDMVTRSMQTSCGSLSGRSSLSDRFRCVPPSFLAKLNNLGEERQAPIYVIYPNYALPDLGFVKTHSVPADVIFSPFNYKTAMSSGSGGGGGSASGSTSSLQKKRINFGDEKNEDEILKNMDYKHVEDWQSLATLLPDEYRQRLKHIPEVSSFLRENEAELSQRPLFCMSPPIRGKQPNICDCAQYFQQQQPPTAGGDAAGGGGGGSSSSGSSQQPSSGYRGSSTLLTDSELDNPTQDPLKPMYVYQYEQTRMDSGVESSPGRTPPQPMPRGILRKCASQSSGGRIKRNSMIEEQQQTRLTKLEKRRSLQEPPYQHILSGGSAEELCEVFEEESSNVENEVCAAAVVAAPRKERLSRKDLDARARAENFLSSLPRSELKYYAEIASILESSASEEQELPSYDAAALKKEVSRVLSQQKKVSFNDEDAQAAELERQRQQLQFLPPDVRQQRFSTPPNSPNISMAANNGALRMPGGASNNLARRELHAAKKAAFVREQHKLEGNRFKRLQIQWELMSKDSSMLKELASAQQTKSGGSTPTSAVAAATAAAAAAAAAHKSRIPRPVSYPAGKISAQEAASGKTTRSPSRIVPPKRYSLVTSPVAAAATSPSTANTPAIGTAAVAAVTNTTATTTTTTPPTSAPAAAGGTPRSRTPSSRNAVTAPNTPKRRVQSPRNIPRVR